jgi:hypothetical protein
MWTLATFILHLGLALRLALAVPSMAPEVAYAHAVAAAAPPTQHLPPQL